MSALLIAELRARGAALRLGYERTRSLAYPLESGPSRARRNRKAGADLALAQEYEALADAVEFKGALE